MVRLLFALTLTLKIYGTLGANTTIMVHLVQKTFTDQAVNAAAGDVVQFISLNPRSPFRVIQTSFSEPCRPLQNGFDSGSIFGTAPYTVNVTSLDPIWFYEDGLCADGMVGAINAPTTGDTFDAFIAAAWTNYLDVRIRTERRFFAVIHYIYYNIGNLN
ncbi:hypothetical protein EXIGLDRAFT_783015 [Exidia glandulosa HHB12029]|uniref:Uncharacterized protein n=1 Tax=Exidia glandulosa HHB12029 TaxID=1314781 RepID=A0A166NAU0_EXIGL|nr:hypothetical protein EXIGLDRAFT_783015 [Exidia glandulosa HHB12029]